MHEENFDLIDTIWFKQEYTNIVIIIDKLYHVIQLHCTNINP